MIDYVKRDVWTNKKRWRRFFRALHVQHEGRWGFVVTRPLSAPLGRREGFLPCRTS
jgi:hypothetical protein